MLIIGGRNVKRAATLGLNVAALDGFWGRKLGWSGLDHAM